MKAVSQVNGGKDLPFGTVPQKEVKEFFLALLFYNSPKAHNALC